MNEFYAYGNDHAELEAVMRLHAVKRWHMIDTTRAQTLAEHSANVAVLAFHIAHTAPGMFFGPAENVAAYALMHDMAEVFTGDFPSHSKKHLFGVRDLEEKVLPRSFVIDQSPETKLMVKLCDLADGIRFIRLHGVDVTSRHAKEGLQRQLEARKTEAGDSGRGWPREVYEKVSYAVQFYAYEFS